MMATRTLWRGLHFGEVDPEEFKRAQADPVGYVRRQMGGYQHVGIHWTDDPQCLAPGTPVLCADLTWRPIADLIEGDEIIGFDEFRQGLGQGILSRGARSYYRRAIVEQLGRAQLPSYRIVTEFGEVVASSQHLWLVGCDLDQSRAALSNPLRVSRHSVWRATEGLRVGDKIVAFGPTWETDRSWEAGWLAGIADGEGFLTDPNPTGHRLTATPVLCPITQLEGKFVWEEALELLARRGTDVRVTAVPAGAKQAIVTSRYEAMRFLGEVRPFRLLDKAHLLWEDRTTRHSKGSRSVPVLDIEYIGPQEVVTIGTSTRTLIAGGLYSHNSAFNFAEDKDPEGWAHESWDAGDEDLSGYVVLGAVLEAQVPEESILDPDSEEGQGYQFSDSIIDYRIEREVTVRAEAAITITDITLCWTDVEGMWDEGPQHPVQIRTTAAQSIKPLPLEKGLYYRLHRKGAPFGPEHATTAPLFPPENAEKQFSKEFVDRWIKPQPGYSAFWNPLHLQQYIEDMGLDPSQGEVIAFRGRPTGQQGGDGEPTVIPNSNKIEFRVRNWDNFKDRLEVSDGYGYGGWQDNIGVFEKPGSLRSTAGVAPVFRGLNLDLDADTAERYYMALAEKEFDKASSVILQAVQEYKEEAGLGTHWSFRRDIAERFCSISSEHTVTVRFALYNYVPVVVEADYLSDQIEYKPDELTDQAVSGYGWDSREEAEVTLKRGAQINIRAFWLAVPHDLEWAGAIFEQGQEGGVSLPFTWMRVPDSTQVTAATTKIAMPDAQVPMQSFKRREMGWLSKDGEWFLERGAPMVGGGTAWIVWRHARPDQLEIDEYGAYPKYNAFPPHLLGSSPAQLLPYLADLKTENPPSTTPAAEKEAFFRSRDDWYVQLGDAGSLAEAKSWTREAVRKVATPTVRLYHGTNQMALDAIRASGHFVAIDPEEVAHLIEERYDLPYNSVWTHPWNGFSRDRKGDPLIYFSQNFETSTHYAQSGTEVTYDAIKSAGRIKFGPSEMYADFEPGAETRIQRFVREEITKHYKPVVLTLEAPWEEFKRIYMRTYKPWGKQPSEPDIGWFTEGEYDYLPGTDFAEKRHHELNNTLSLEGPIPASWIVKVDSLIPDLNPVLSSIHKAATGTTDLLAMMLEDYPTVEILPKAHGGFFVTPEGQMVNVRIHEDAAQKLIGRPDVGGLMNQTGCVRVRTTPRDITISGSPDHFNSRVCMTLAEEADGRDFYIQAGASQVQSLSSPSSAQVLGVLRKLKAGVVMAINKTQYERDLWWRGQIIELTDGDREAFLHAWRNGATSVMRDLLQTQVAYEYGGAGHWWSPRRSDAEMYGGSFNADAKVFGPNIPAVRVGVIYGAHLAKEHWNLTQLEPGMALVIQEMYAYLPSPGDEYGTRRWVQLPIPLMETTATQTFFPALIASWEQTKPWDMERKQLESGAVPGVVVGQARGSEDASYDVSGRIVLKDQWFERSSEVRRATLYHEAGHALETRFGMASFQRLGIDNPLDIHGWSGAQGLGGNYSEVLAEAYAALWTDPSWFNRMGASKIHDLIVRMARQEGFPIPAGSAIGKVAKVYVFDITYSTSKDTLKAGEVVSGTRQVGVEADNEGEARLLAEQMVAAVGNEPTGATLVSSPDLDREVLGKQAALYQPDHHAPEEGFWTFPHEPRGPFNDRGNPSWHQQHRALVADALHSWKGDPISMAIHLDDEAKDAPQPDSGSGKMMRAQAGALAWEVANNPTTFDHALHRGELRKSVPEVGDVLDYSRRPRGFTTSRAAATSFSKDKNARPWDDPVHPVVITSAPGAKGLKVSDYCGVGGVDQYEKEHVLGGMHRVVSVEPPTEKRNHWRVRTEPISDHKTAALTSKDYEGRIADRSHMTRKEEGMIPTAVIADLPGVQGEVPGEHRNRQGEKWESFKRDIQQNGIQNPIFITVDYAQQPKISEGNHRRDAAVELGMPEVPVEIRYFGHAQRDGSVLERHQRRIEAMTRA